MSDTEGLIFQIRKPSKVAILLVVLLSVLLVLSVTFIALYAKEKRGNDSRDTSTMDASCSSAACVASAAAILKDIDTSVNPCDNFYQYSCGGFIERNHFRQRDMDISGFSIAADFVAYALKERLEDDQLMANYSKDSKSAVLKALRFYKICMNETFVEEIYKRQIANDTNWLASWNITYKNFTGSSWTLEKILAKIPGTFLTLEPIRYPFNNSLSFQILLPGYTARDLLPKMLSGPKFEKAYKEFMVTILKKLGANLSTVEQEVEALYKLEFDFAKIRRNFNNESEKLGYEKTLRRMTLPELYNLTSFKFNWTEYVIELSGGKIKYIPSNTTFLAGLPNNIKQIIDWITDQKKRIVIKEMVWKHYMSNIDMSPKYFRDAFTKLKEASTGLRCLSSRWRKCVDLTHHKYKYVTTALYVNGHLSDRAVNWATEAFTEIKNAFIEGLEELTWMDDETRNEARKKLKDMKRLVGYPPVIKNFTKLNEKYKNVQVSPPLLLPAAATDDDEGWSGSDPLVVNAFYDPPRNLMVMPGGFLQLPFYKDDRQKALNYGGLGMVVGHEITHGFDTSGRKYDEKGNYRSWWTNQSYNNFKKRSECFIDQYNNVTIFGRRVDGKRTIGENIADNGGLKYAFRAYQKWQKKHGKEGKLPGVDFTNDQLFFIGFAQAWCTKFRKEFIDYDMNGVHAISPVRILIPVRNMPAFSKAFGCTPPNNTCSLW